MFDDIKVELAARHHRELIAAAARERLGREARAASRPPAAPAGLPAVPAWRARLGGRLIRWGVALADEGGCRGAISCEECSFPL